MPAVRNTLLLAGLAVVAAYSFQDTQLTRIGFPSRETDPWTLQYAAAHGQVSLAEMLLKLGLDVNGRSAKGNRALDIACLKGNAAVVKTLVEHGADVKLQNSAGSTPLHDAALSGNAEVGEILLTHGAALDAFDPETGTTPLYNAVSFGKAEVTKLLTSKSANKNAKLKSGKTILDAAKASGLDSLFTAVGK